MNFSTIDPLGFLYITLGVGFLLLIIFTCIAIYHVIRILKDVADTTDTVRDVVVTVGDSIESITSKVNSTTDQVLSQLIKPLALIQFFTDKIQPILDRIPRKYMEPKHREEPEEYDDEYDDEYDEDEFEDAEPEEKPKKRRRIRKTSTRKKSSTKKTRRKRS